MSKGKKHSLQLLGWIPQKCILGNFSQGSLAGYQCVFSWLQLGNNKLILRLLRIPLLLKLLTVKDLPPLNLDYALFADCCFCPRGCLRSSGGIQQTLAVGGSPSGTFGLATSGAQELTLGDDVRTAAQQLLTALTDEVLPVPSQVFHTLVVF